MNLFKRRTPAPPPDDRLPVAEALIASAAGYTQQQWCALTDQQRATYRWNYRPQAKETR